MTTAVTRTEETDSPYALSHLDALESEAVHIFREVAGEFEKPVILFSGGKDSIVMLHLALKAFTPAPVPFALLHVDTGHNFPEVLEYRDRVVAAQGCASMSPPSRTTSTAVCSRNAPTAPATPSRPSP
ncbi:Sulfate adenylyltransferase subunit 2 [Streptomyces fumanus]